MIPILLLSCQHYEYWTITRNVAATHNKTHNKQVIKAYKYVHSL